VKTQNVFQPPPTYRLPSPSQLRFHTSVSASVAKAFCKSEASAFQTNFDGHFRSEMLLENFDGVGRIFVKGSD